jgi:hypothetical protein
MPDEQLRDDPSRQARRTFTLPLIALFAGFGLLSLQQQQHRKPGSWHRHIVAERRQQ